MNRSLMIAGCCVAVWLSTMTSAVGQTRDLATLQLRFQNLHADYVQRAKNVISGMEGSLQERALAVMEPLLRLVPDADLRAIPLSAVTLTDPPDDWPADQRIGWNQLRELRRNHAQDLFLLSRVVLKGGFPSYTLYLVRETARQNPDHDQARRLLGFVRQGAQWMTPLQARMLKDGYVWDDRFGWILKGHLSRYEAGERIVDGRWMSAAKANEIRHDFRRAWEVRTDHYLIRTNVSLEKGVELGKHLEEFYTLFHDVFAGFFTSQEQMLKMFDGSSAAVRTVARPYLVNCYRDKDEYVRRLKKQFPQIDQTNGLYYPSDRTVHIFTEPDDDHLVTLCHEGTHQLFFESHSSERMIAEISNFWMVEGIACYMETFRQVNGELTLGDPAYIRFQQARQALLVDRYYVPLEEFSAMGQRAFQNHQQLAKNYAQAAGLAAFFMQYENGRYRDAVVAHLTQLYSATPTIRARARDLSDLTGVPFSTLDEQYEMFMRGLEQSPQ